MKTHLNTLFITTQGAYLAREGETIIVRVEKETKLRVPIHMLAGIVCFGRVGASPALMGLCGERGIGLSFLSINGRFLARVQGPINGNVLLRRAQYRSADDSKASAALARGIVAGKLLNARTVLVRARRKQAGGPGHDALTHACVRLRDLINTVGSCTSVDIARGHEGEAARHYFGVFDHLVHSDDDRLRFERRSRRPPRNPVNALLSFLYTLLVHDVTSAIEGVGLDPAVGFLHRERPGRPSLALDLMEELRPVLADRVALSLLNRKQLQAKDFIISETGAVAMSDGARKIVLGTYQKRKQTDLRHPFLDEITTLGLVPHLQARLLARHLRGDLDAYPPFLAK